MYKVIVNAASLVIIVLFCEVGLQNPLAPDTWKGFLINFLVYVCLHLILDVRGWLLEKEVKNG